MISVSGASTNGSDNANKRASSYGKQKQPQKIF
jgi:hypothetical protein